MQFQYSPLTHWPIPSNNRLMIVIFIFGNFNGCVLVCARVCVWTFTQNVNNRHVVIWYDLRWHEMTCPIGGYTCHCVTNQKQYSLLIFGFYCAAFYERKRKSGDFSRTHTHFTSESEKKMRLIACARAGSHHYKRKIEDEKPSSLNWPSKYNLTVEKKIWSIFDHLKVIELSLSPSLPLFDSRYFCVRGMCLKI